MVTNQCFCNTGEIFDKKIITTVLSVAIVLLACLIVGAKLLHTCSDCGDFFVGTGYEPGIIAETFVKETGVICKYCAEKQHALEIALGKTVEDFRIGLFE